MNNLSTPGFYGKLPCRGDFLTRLPREFVQPWDTWLQTSIVNSREQLADLWVEAYLVSPIWHFMLSAHLCGTTAWLGLIMPSVDKVGRYFPLTVAVKLPPQMTVSQLGDEAISDWFARADHLALSTLEEPFELIPFEQQLAQLGAPVVPTMSTKAVAPVQPQPVSEQGAWYVPLSELEDLPVLCQRAENFLQNSTWKTYSLWWMAETENFQNAMLFCEGLPPPSGFAALLDGEWQRWGWLYKATLYA